VPGRRLARWRGGFGRGREAALWGQRFSPRRQTDGSVVVVLAGDGAGAPPPPSSAVDVIVVHGSYS
jgi:hypothetical protein